VEFSREYINRQGIRNKENSVRCRENYDEWTRNMLKNEWGLD
jgi:hypothetical protein